MNQNTYKRKKILPEKFFYGYTPIASGNQIYLERPRINRLMEKAAQYPVVSVVAGAGYGKTHAVYSFVRRCNVKTVWIQCSEMDNSGERFWENFISAVSIINKETAARLMTIEFPASEQQYDNYIKILKKDVIPNEKYFLVYDDLHLITEKTVLGFLEHFLVSYFPNITTMLISRNEPTLNLAKPAEKKLLARITGNELLFSRNEMVSYFKLQQITPAPQTASVIYHYTEGWAFAIHLAALSLRNISHKAAYIPQALRSNTFKLIESEIMSGLSPELRRFLVKLSLVENLGPDLLRELEKDDSVIEQMENITSFIRFDTGLKSYRIHHLFMDYLRERQDELSEEEKKDVWSKTAEWCALNNHKMDAIINYEKTGNYSGIISILNTLPLVLNTQMAGFILDILDRAPETIYRDYPDAIVMRNRVLVSLGLFEQSHRETLATIPVLNALEESPGKHSVLMASYLNLGFIGLIQATYTRNYDFTDPFRKAAGLSRKTEFVVTPPVNGINLSSYACRIMAPSSMEEIEKYMTVIGEIVPYAAEAMGGCLAGMYELARGEFAFFKGQLEEAENYLIECLGKARENRQYEIENRALFYLLRIYLSRGNARKTENILLQLEAELNEQFFLNRYIYHDIVTGWYYIQTGRRDRLAFWLKSDYEESELNLRAQGLEKLVKAKYYLSEKRYPAALAAIQSRGVTEPLLFGDIEMKALEAVCRYRRLDREGAFAALGEAFTLAAPAGLFMPFAELGKDMRALTEAALKDRAAFEKAPVLSREWLEDTRRSAAVYAKKLYRRQTGSGLGESSILSYRETEVLKGLSQGLTREEIAGGASISPNTVKSVTRSIYNKLGALNKADAVRIATEKGILPQ